MNKVILIGRLTSDPKVTTANEKAVARFNVAVDRRGKDAVTDFPSCVAFGKTAEFIEKYCKKGTKLALEGRIQTGSYKNKDGATVYTTDINVDNVEFVESKAQADQSETKVADGFMDVSESIDSEIPFR